MCAGARVKGCGPEKGNLAEMGTLSRIWRRWGKWLQVGGTLFLFAYLLKTAPVAEALQQLKGTRLGFTLVGGLLMVTGLIIYAYTWSLALRGVGLAVRFRRVCSLFFQALFVNNLASFLGGDLVRGYKLGRATRRTFDVGISVLVSRVAMLYTLVVLAGATTWSWAPRAGWPESVRWAGAAVTLLGPSLWRPLVAYSRPS